MLPNYLGGVLSCAGGVAGGVVSDGGMVVVVPGAVDGSVVEGAGVESAGGEAAEPAGEVDSCFEQADRAASAPTHNNRTLRFIGITSLR